MRASFLEIMPRPCVPLLTFSRAYQLLQRQLLSFSHSLKPPNGLSDLLNCHFEFKSCQTSGKSVNNPDTFKLSYACQRV